MSAVHPSTPAKPSKPHPDFLPPNIAKVLDGGETGSGRPNGLARDIQCYLHDEPVQACLVLCSWFVLWGGFAIRPDALQICPTKQTPPRKRLGGASGPHYLVAMMELGSRRLEGVCRLPAIPTMLITVAIFNKMFLAHQGVCQGVGKRDFLSDYPLAT